MKIERELKVVAETGTQLPDLSAAVEGLVVGETEQLNLSATYYDTPDHSLLSGGLTLRSRSGEPGPTWTLKLPAGGEEGALHRHEVNFDGDLGVVPAAALEAVTAYVRRAKLATVADIHTSRAATSLRIGDAIVATICDDHVEGRYGGDGVSKFREVEVELITPIPGVDLLKIVRTRLREAGWKIEVTPLPKLTRVLGDTIGEDPLVHLPRISRKSSLKDAVRAVIVKSVRELITFDPGTRLDLDIEDLHQFRVAARRLRSDLRTFRGVLDRSWVNGIRTELSWLGECVGSVRDLDVLTERFTKAVHLLDDSDSADAAPLLSALGEQRAALRSEMLAALNSPRYLDLLETLVEAAHRPHFAHPTETNEEHDHDAQEGSRVERLACLTLPGLVRKTWKQLKGAADELGPNSPDEDLHDVRILAKRCRYATEAAVPVCGRPARRFAAAIKELQGLLGDHQDTVVAEAWLRDTARSTPTIGVLAGLLIAAERDKRLVLRTSLEEVWKQTSHDSLRPWLKRGPRRE